MSTAPNQRSVKIGEDERGGWSSDRPRSGPARPPDISTRCRVLRPTDRMRYSPGSLLVVLSPSAAESDRFVERVIAERGVVFSLGRVRGLLAGRVSGDELDERASELLVAAVRKRLEASDTVVLPAETLDASEREPFLRMAAALRRPRHVILLEAGRDDADEDARAKLNDLRKALDSGELGSEGFQTAMRLGGDAISELKGIVFAPPPAED
jgi:predicted kinase